MALPHLSTQTYRTRKAIYESAIVRRRNQDNDRETVWRDVSKYFHHQNIVCQKDKDWTSKHSWQDSMDAFSKQQDLELKALSLKRRRAKLATLLRDETNTYQAELSGLSKDNLTRLHEMKGRSEELKSAREEKRKQLAQDLLYEQWKKNDPRLRQLEEEQHRHYVIGKWGDQKVEKDEALATAREQEAAFARGYEALATAREQEAAFARGYEAERQKALERMRREREEKVEEEKRIKAVLREQVEELRRQETQAALLRKEQDALLLEKWELEKLDEKRKEEQAQRKRKEIGRILLRQHAASLRRKSKQIQEDLERDREFLAALTSRESEDRQMMTSRREKARADARWMKQVIEDQLKVERAREAELDMLYADEAAKEWEKREAQWAREQVARERLMQEVMDGRQDQIRDRMSAIREEQEDSLKRREELLREIEVANQLTRREQEEEEHAKTERKEELEAQMSSRLAEKREREELLRLEVEEEMREEDDYEELLQQETERMRIEGFQPKTHSRKPPPKSAWM